MTDTRELLRQLATQIRDERKLGANTATRVGSLLLAIIDAGVDIEELASYFIRKDRPDKTDYLLEANGGLVVRKQELVESSLMSLVEESEDSLIEEIDVGGNTPGATTTLGGLTNVNNNVDNATNGSLLIKGENEWSSIPPILSSLSDYDNMLIPVFHKVLGKWVFISVSSIAGGTPPVLEMILDVGVLDINKLA